MSASILSLAAFRLKREGVAAVMARSWSQQELAELHRMRDRLVRAGRRVLLDIGTTERGEPFAAFRRSEGGDAFLRIARLNGAILVANVSANLIYCGLDFRSIADELLIDEFLLHAGQARMEGVADGATAADAHDPEKTAAATGMLPGALIDRILARDPAVASPLVLHGSAANLMAAAIGAAWMFDTMSGGSAGLEGIPVMRIPTDVETAAGGRAVAVSSGGPNVIFITEPDHGFARVAFSKDHWSSSGVIDSNPRARTAEAEVDDSVIGEACGLVFPLMDTHCLIA